MTSNGNAIFPVHIRKNECSLVQFNTGVPLDLNAATEFRFSKIIKKSIINNDAEAGDKTSRKQSVKNSQNVIEETCICSKLKIQNVTKIFNGIEEKAVMSNSSYFILSRNGNGGFDAYPISAWYKMKPSINYRILNAEEAEHEFFERNKRDAITRQMIRMKMNPDDPTSSIESQEPSKSNEKQLKHSSDDDQDKANRLREKSNNSKPRNEQLSDDDDYIESMEVDYMSDSNSGDDAVLNQRGEQFDKIPDDDLNAALSHDNKYVMDEEDSDAFVNVSENTDSIDDEPTHVSQSKPRSRKRPIPDSDDEADSDEELNDDDDDNFDDLENTYSNIALPTFADNDNPNPELDNFVESSSSNTNTPINSERNNMVESQSVHSDTSSLALLKNELEKKVQRLVVASLKGNSITSAELMQKVIDGLSSSIPRNVLVKLVGAVMKKCKFTRRVVNNSVYFSMK